MAHPTRIFKVPTYEMKIEETSELKVNFMENPAHGVNAISFQDKPIKKKRKNDRKNTGTDSQE